MAINVNFNGRLGADSELKTNSNNGKQFVAMRVATDEFRNGKRDTIWVNVVDYSDKTKNMAAYLKKGSLVNIHGVESVNLYQSKNGETMISQDVISDRIDFVGSSSGNTTTNKTEVNETTNEMSCGTFKRAEAQEPQMAMATPPQGVINNDDNDDLPF